MDMPKGLPVSLAGLSERELILMTLQTVSTNHKNETAQIEELKGEVQRLKTTVYKDEERINKASTIVWTMATIIGVVSALLATTYYILKLSGHI